MVRQLAEALGGDVACTRPLVETGWMEAAHQIGLSGRTVRPKLIITCGVSGAIQFVAGKRMMMGILRSALGRESSFSNSWSLLR